MCVLLPAFAQTGFLYYVDSRSRSSQVPHCFNCNAVPGALFAEAGYELAHCVSCAGPNKRTPDRSPGGLHTATDDGNWRRKAGKLGYVSSAPTRGGWAELDCLSCHSSTQLPPFQYAGGNNQYPTYRSRRRLTSLNRDHPKIRRRLLGGCRGDGAPVPDDLLPKQPPDLRALGRAAATIMTFRSSFSLETDRCTFLIASFVQTM
ncbi:hypothetical protein VUR80DRAFT_7302 [Thermomyces stellatus]